MATPTKKAESTTVLHAQLGDNHLVGVKALRVLLLKDGQGWFAQGLEIDYASSGATIEDVKKNFEKGLALTMKEHLVLYGTIERLLKVAPQEAWKEFYAAPPETVKASYSAIQAFTLIKQVAKAADLPKVFPFDTIQFIQPKAEEAVAA